jgi:hypothetical protein
LIKKLLFLMQTNISTLIFTLTPTPLPGERGKNPDYIFLPPLLPWEKGPGDEGKGQDREKWSWDEVFRQARDE